MTATNRSPKFSLPTRPSLEHLRKEAKHRLAELRARGGAVQLADAQLLVAREYGFSSWRALKAAVEESPPPISWSRPPLNHHRVASSYIAVRDGVRTENLFFNFIALAMLLACMAMTADFAARNLSHSPGQTLANLRIIR